jgi:hypothetical protein
MLHFNLRLCILQLEIQRSITSLPVSDTNLRQFTFDCVERLSRLTTLVEVSDELRRAGGAFGFGTFCISGFPDPGERLDPYVMLSGWPEAWMKRYAASGYVHMDPVVRRVRQTTVVLGRDKRAGLHLIAICAHGRAR